MTQRYNVVDLFAGVGGLSFGFAELEDFNIVAANEILPDIAKSYELNHPKAKVLVGDIADLTEEMLKEATNGQRIDLVVGGPPCQSYSTLGKRQMDDRANLFTQYKRVLEILQPKAFIFENVPGLLSMQGGKLFPEIRNEFEKLGYNLKYKLLNAVDYGVPQERKRIILVGFKGENTFEYPEPTHGKGLKPYVTLENALGDLPVIKSGQTNNSYVREPDNEFLGFVRKGGETTLTEHSAPQNNPQLIALMEALGDGQNKDDLPEELRPSSGYGNTYAKLWWKRPATTVTRNFACPSSSRCIHPRDSRALSIREGARLQSFPDDYKFYGSQTNIKLGIGNAVPCLLSRALAGQMLKALRKSEEEHRDRSSGWKHAKLSGHSNEELVCEMLRNDSEQQKRLLETIGEPKAKIVSCDYGGLHEAEVPSVMGGMTKSKADITVSLDNGKSVGVSVKKSLAGQVFLIRDENFIKGFELQYGVKIPDKVKRAIALFWGSAEDTTAVIDQYSDDDTIKKYELHKNRLVAQTLQKYDPALYQALLDWLKENIYNITDYCFARGQAKNESNRATVVWYINLLGEHEIDAMYHIDTLCKAANNNKDVIQFGTRNGGSTIALPFGFVQWHQAQMQFHHRYEMIAEMLNSATKKDESSSQFCV